MPALTADTTAPPVISLGIGNSLALPTMGVLFCGFSNIEIGTPWGGNLLVWPGMPVIAFPLPSAGVTISTMISTPPADELDLQVLELDPGASSGISFSPGLRLTPVKRLAARLLAWRR
ncbi:MAG: hypothetical protein U1E76_24330 [Planctomycetota bacterium]